MGRILELKNEMVLLEFSEYHYFDDVLSDLKLTPVSSINLIWNMEIVIYMYCRVFFPQILIMLMYFLCFRARDIVVMQSATKFRA